MRVLSALASLGYEIELIGNNIKLHYMGNSEPDKVIVTLLIKELKANKDKAIEELRRGRVVDTQPVPYIDATGTLVIPFDSDPKYHWWRGGQSITETLKELNASPDVLVRYSPKYRNQRS